MTGAATVYGIAACGSCRAARRWLEAAGIAFRFHDYDLDGVDAAALDLWIAEHGWEAVLNRRSRTWRALPEAARSGLDAASAAALMRGHSRLIRRPVIARGGCALLGFTEAARAALAGDGG